MSSLRATLVAAGTAALTMSTACGGSPAAPSASSSLVVRVLDEQTQQLITDNDTGITVRLESGVSYSQRARDGVARFPAINPGTYRVTASVEFGFRQPNVVSIVADSARSFDLLLTPIDDVIATDIVVDGQGSIPRGGTIDIPAQGGINIHYTGKWRSVTAPFSDTGAFHLGVSFEDAGGLNRSETLALRPTEWERSLSGFVPCIGVVSAPIQCRSQASTLRVIIYRTVGSHTVCHTGAGCFQDPEFVTVAAKAINWPVTFRLAPGCCRLD